MMSRRKWTAATACGVAAVALILWKSLPDRVTPEVRIQNRSDGTRHKPAGSAAPLARNPASEPAGFNTPFTMERLSTEHDRTPRAEEWAELTRILLNADDGDLVDAVKARFSLHAGTQELATLGDAYDNPTNDTTRQRIIEIFSTLQSADFMEAARQIVTNESIPISDQLIAAAALSLVRKGEQQDILAIFKRLNASGEDADPEGSLYSDADGLMYALSEAENPALEDFFVKAAAGTGAATTGRSRMVAAAALRNYHTVHVTEVLYEISRNEPNARVRKQAKLSLEAIQTSE
ncbi:MAG: hypothetical protein V4819_16850 [Verrucomicrobiota bacterium]